MDLTERQWLLVKPLIPEEPWRVERRGRPWKDSRTVLDGILWILRTGAPWKDLPERYGAFQTAHRRYLKWLENGSLFSVLITLAKDLNEASGQDFLRGCFDMTFTPETTRILKWLRANNFRSSKSWMATTAMLFLSPTTWEVLRLQMPVRKAGRPGSSREVVSVTPRLVLPTSELGIIRLQNVGESQS